MLNKFQLAHFNIINNLREGKKKKTIKKQDDKECLFLRIFIANIKKITVKLIQ